METSDHISQEEFEQIERYLLGELSAEQKHGFESSMHLDPVLRQKVSAIKAILEEVELSGLHESMAKFHNEVTEKKEIMLEQQPRGKSRWTWAVAAAVLLALGFSWVFWGMDTAHERLFTAYYEPDPGLVTAMGTSDQYEFDRGMVDYKTGQYQSAIARWEKLLQQKPDNDTLNYFLGASYLALQNAEKAIPYFQSTLQTEASIFANDAWWYLGLTWLNQGETDKAKEALQKSDKPESKELLDELARQ